MRGALFSRDMRWFSLTLPIGVTLGRKSSSGFELPITQHLFPPGTRASPRVHFPPGETGQCRRLGLGKGLASSSMKSRKGASELFTSPKWPSGHTRADTLPAGESLQSGVSFSGVTNNFKVMWHEIKQLDFHLRIESSASEQNKHARA